MPRSARLDAPGVLHHIIIRGMNDRMIFADDSDRDNLLERLAVLLPENLTAFYAWAFLPDHVHLLIRRGPEGMSRLMQRLLTGYARSFNRRHRRKGALFQNRFESFVCHEDVYFKELVRYIHLNPIRRKRVKNVEALNTFSYSGHAALMGNQARPWQDTRFVLSAFGKRIQNRTSIIWPMSRPDMASTEKRH